MLARRSLLHRRHDLAEPCRQLEILTGACKPFDAILAERGIPRLETTAIEVLQINVGKVCNQTCRHCHVDAGPDRRESMSVETIDACLAAVARAKIPTVDITGGAPEMHPEFRRLVIEARALGAHVIDRCNLTILLAPGFDDLPEFLAKQKVEIIASLPCYLAENADAQRGDGVFDRSIESLRRLNALGYGRSGGTLRLNLVYNPIGPSLPPNQAELELTYKDELRSRYGIEFDRLFTITNMPISRFLEDLVDSGRFESYMGELVGAFNPSAIKGLMCRSTVSVGWDGRLFDCDFNQMLNIPVESTRARTIHEFDPSQSNGLPIATANHCFGCTAGSGSSCGGAVT